MDIVQENLNAIYGTADKSGDTDWNNLKDKLLTQNFYQWHDERFPDFISEILQKIQMSATFIEYLKDQKMTGKLSAEVWEHHNFRRDNPNDTDLKDKIQAG